MTRGAYIELVRRQIYGGQPSDDATITEGLVNTWLNPAIGYAAQRCYYDNKKLDGIAFVADSFHTTFKALTISKDETFVWKVTLPHIPIGLGHNDGISTAVIKETTTNISRPVVLLNQQQKSFYQGMREVPNKVLGYIEGGFLFLLSQVQLNAYTASVTMVSGGVSTDLGSTLTIPDDYLVYVTEYIQKQLYLERNTQPDLTNDGTDIPTTNVKAQ